MAFAYDGDEFPAQCVGSLVQKLLHAPFLGIDNDRFASHGRFCLSNCDLEAQVMSFTCEEARTIYTDLCRVLL